MGDFALLLETHLCQGLPQGRIVENRVVAEAVVAFRLSTNLTVHPTSHFKSAPSQNKTDDADKMGRSSGGLLNGTHQAKELLNSALVGGGKTSREDSRGPSQGIDLQTRVVGQRRDPGQAVVMGGLKPGIFTESGAAFGYFRYSTRSGCRPCGDSELTGDRLA